jgi:outer membrane protein
MTMMNNIKSKIVQIKQHLFPLLLILLSFVSLPAAAETTHVTIAVVDVAYLMKNAPEAESAGLELKTRFSPRELELSQELEKINQLEAERERNLNTWTTEQRQKNEREVRTRKRDRTRALEDFREELRFARDTALDAVQQSVFQAIEDVRAEREIDVVIEEYVAASNRVNITPAVLEYLQRKFDQKQANAQDNKKSTEQ